MSTTFDISKTSAYQQKLMGLLGSREPFDVLGSTVDVLAQIVAENSSQNMRTRPFEGKWTPNEIIGHLADADWVLGFRSRMILCEDNPVLMPMDQDLWVAGQKYNEREPKENFETFQSLRRANLLLWKRLTPAELSRTGQHAERGPESLGLLVRMYAGHDLSHIDQITRYLAAIKGA